MDTLVEIRLETSSFTAAGWDGSFYPKGTKSVARLAFYAEYFDTVEIDSTFCSGWPGIENAAGFYFLVFTER